MVILTPRLGWSQCKILGLDFSNALNPNCAPVGGENHVTQWQLCKHKICTLRWSKMVPLALSCNKNMLGYIRCIHIWPAWQETGPERVTCPHTTKTSKWRIICVVFNNLEYFAAICCMDRTVILWHCIWEQESKRSEGLERGWRREGGSSPLPDPSPGRAIIVTSGESSAALCHLDGGVVEGYCTGNTPILVMITLRS